MSMINWNEMWRDTDDSKERSDNLEYWNNFAPRFRRKMSAPDPYVELFYEYMEAEPGETFFDMGCGSGTLAIPFAKKGHRIVAADFSPEMLRFLRQGAEEEGVSDLIETVELNWNEDWSKRDLPVCDIAFSSRSIISRDLTQALLNLESVARRKVCMGVWDIPVPGYDRHIAKAIGYERPGIGTHYMVMGELMDRDVFPEMKYIYSPFRPTRYESRQEAETSLRNAFTHMTDEQEKQFDKYIEERLIYHPEKGICHGRELDGYWQLDHNDNSSIAFISWNIKSVYE